MRIFILIFLLFCSPKKSNSQSKEINKFENLKRIQIELRTKNENDNTIFPFSEFKVIDKRYDTSTLGYYEENGQLQTYKITTKNNFSLDLENYLNHIYQNNFSKNNYSLIVVLRRFWIGIDNLDITNFKNIDSFKLSNDFLTLKIDFFLKKDNFYIPLFRKDTILDLNKKFLQFGEGILLGETIQAFFNKLTKTNFLEKETDKHLSIEKFNEYYASQFSYPIYSANLKKGVYKNFTEFKNNAPSILDYQIKRVKLVSDIYVNEGNEYILTRKVWGYCDGTNIYVKLGFD